MCESQELKQNSGVPVLVSLGGGWCETFTFPVHGGELEAPAPLVKREQSMRHHGCYTWRVAKALYGAI